jgi:hypothetical protein
MCARSIRWGRAHNAEFATIPNVKDPVKAAKK